MRGITASLLLTFLLMAHVGVLNQTAQAWKALPRGDSDAYIMMPAPLLKVVSLEYDGLVSDYLFIKTMVFIGEHLEKEKGRSVELRLTEQEWKWFYRILDVSSDMDPYFSDPYYVGNAYLTWDAGMVREANTLLEKGSRYRDWDWVLPFFTGFNCFFFLQDNVKATDYLMEASRRPGASAMLADLASKLAYEDRRTENSIAFLEEILSKMNDVSMKKAFQTRIRALKAILSLENAVAVFQKKFGKKPMVIEDLVSRKIISALPSEPYGGKYYLDKQGSVKTTSEAKLLPYRHQ
jgi:hypothetical protein